jgi:hypothetical protein
MRADLAALGVRLGWVAPDDQEEHALMVVAERLRHEGDRILLIYDNALNADAVKSYLPLWWSGASAHHLKCTRLARCGNSHRDPSLA